MLGALYVNVFCSESHLMLFANYNYSNFFLALPILNNDHARNKGEKMKENRFKNKIALLYFYYSLHFSKIQKTDKISKDRSLLI